MSSAARLIAAGLVLLTSGICNQRLASGGVGNRLRAHILLMSFLMLVLSSLLSAMVLRIRFWS